MGSHHMCVCVRSSDKNPVSASFTLSCPLFVLLLGGFGVVDRDLTFCAVSDELEAKKPARTPTTTDRRIEREWLIHGLSVHVKQSLRNSRKFRNSDGSVTNQQNHCTDLLNR